MTRPFITLALLSALGCASPYGSGRLDVERGYVADELPLRVTADGLDALNPRWAVVSHLPSGAQRTGWNDLHVRQTDWDDDGRPSRYRAFRNHLRFTERTGAGEMWLQSTILEPEVQVRELRHIADHFLSSVAEGSPGRAVWTGRRIELRAAQPALEVDVLSRMDGQLAGQQAHLVIFRASRADAAAHTAVLFARAPFRHAQPGSMERVRGWPVLLIAGYTNGPAEFDRGMSDFAKLLETIEMMSNDERFGLGVPDTEGATASEESL